MYGNSTYVIVVGTEDVGRSPKAHRSCHQCFLVYGTTLNIQWMCDGSVTYLSLNATTPNPNNGALSLKNVEVAMSWKTAVMRSIHS